MPRLSTLRIRPEAIFEARTERRMTQEKLAREMGYSLYTIGAYERGKLNPSQRALSTMAEVLDKPEEFFLAEVA